MRPDFNGSSTGWTARSVIVSSEYEGDEMEMAEQEHTPSTDGSRDGAGAADHDQPYQFGQKSTSTWPCPFTGFEFARLLIVRGRVRAAKEQVAAPRSE